MYNVLTSALDISRTEYYAGATSSSGKDYDKTTNFIKQYNGNGEITQTGGLSFPVAIYTRNGTQISSIDKVFTGFGYIGSTVFALPGIKGLFPNGRNKDGSLKNTEFTTSVVRTIGYPGTYFANYKLALSDAYFGIYVPNRLEYQEDINRNYNNNTGKYEGMSDVGYVSSDGTTITSFTPKTTFHVLDYNDKPEISGWSMPSDRYIDLPVGASGAEYVAPADGYYTISITGATNGRTFINRVINNNAIYGCFYTTKSGAADTTGMLPAKKNDVVKIGYDGTVNFLRFIYTKGEQ